MDIYDVDKRSEIMSKIKGKDTTPEKKVRSLLHSLGFRFRLHKNDLPGCPDIVLPKYNTVIFVNGCFWHGHQSAECKIAKIPKSNIAYWKNKIDRNRERDRKKQKELLDLGWDVVVVWECEIRDIDKLMRKINSISRKD
jgi:DNA mismatch endonuclease (patch repair protein)